MSLLSRSRTLSSLQSRSQSGHGLRRSSAFAEQTAKLRQQQETYGAISSPRRVRRKKVDDRRARLSALVHGLRDMESQLHQALHDDFGKPSMEAMAETGFVAGEARYARRNLSSWIAGPRASMPLMHLLSRAEITPVPHGVSLIIGAENYPYLLLLGPLVGALAAGSFPVIKPSEHAPASAAAIENLVEHYLAPWVSVVQGDGPFTKNLVEQNPWDHIFFTGGTTTGRSIQLSAAARGIPVTMELGGNNPTYVDDSYNLAIAAERIVWGRFYNVGKSCVAPGIIFVKEESRDAFVSACLAALERFYGQNPLESKDWGKQGNARQFARVAALLEENRKAIRMGGATDLSTLKIAPTIVVDPHPNSRLLTEETFGPIMTIVGVPDFETALRTMQALPPPLTTYAFTKDPRQIARLREETTSGQLVFGDTVFHFASQIPFGGVGPSGIGAYHGKASFDAFSRLRPVISRSAKLRISDMIRRPPYSPYKEGWFATFQQLRMDLSLWQWLRGGKGK